MWKNMKNNRQPFTSIENIQKTTNTSNDFDVIPQSKDTPNYAYRRDPIRKRCERMLLPGQVCMYCAPFYESMAKVHGEAKTKEMIEKYSRHRDKHPIRSYSPPGLWNPRMTDADLADSS